MKKLLHFVIAFVLLVSTTLAQLPLTTSRAIITSNEIVGSAAGSIPVTAFEVDSTVTTSPRGIMSAQYNDGTDGARFHGRKARGTRAAPTVVVTGDNLTRWVGSGYDGTNFLEMASIIFGTEGTIAATRVPTNIQLQVATDAAPSVLTTTATFGGSTGIALTAIGANQSITLAPSGTGVTKFTGASQSIYLGSLTGAATFGALHLGMGTPSGSNFALTSSGTNLLVNAPLSSGYIGFEQGHSERARFAATTGNLLLGGLTTDGGATKQLQLSSTNVVNFGATANATIGVSADTTGGALTLTAPSSGTISLAPSASGNVTIPLGTSASGGALSLTKSTSTSGATWIQLDDGTSTFRIESNASGSGGGFNIGSVTSHPTKIYGNGAIALTLGASQAATFAGKITSYNGVATGGLGVPVIYGIDNRTGLTGADGAATTLYTTVNGTSLFRISADIFATAAVTGTASYTVTWTQNSGARTMVVTATAINTLGTATDLINPDNATAITAQLTGTFTGTFTVASVVEQLK